MRVKPTVLNCANALTANNTLCSWLTSTWLHLGLRQDPSLLLFFTFIILHFYYPSLILYSPFLSIFVNPITLQLQELQHGSDCDIGQRERTIRRKRVSAAVAEMSRAVKEYNTALCGDILSSPLGWKKYGAYSEISRNFEFVPQWFTEPLRNKLQLQDALCHTQMFVTLVDQQKELYDEKNFYGRLIADWVYYKYYLKARI